MKEWEERENICGGREREKGVEGSRGKKVGYKNIEKQLKKTHKTSWKKSEKGGGRGGVAEGRRWGEEMIGKKRKGGRGGRGCYSTRENNIIKKGTKAVYRITSEQVTLSLSLFSSHAFHLYLFSVLLPLCLCLFVSSCSTLSRASSLFCVF